MIMNPVFLKCVIFLTLINYFHCQYELMNSSLTAMEGSCIEIKFISLSLRQISEADYWFWLKDANWTDQDFVGTVIFSTNEAKRPVDQEFKNRVSYIKSLRTERTVSTELFDIMICDLRKTDSGLYKFRFVSEKDRWATNPVNLTVQENPCLITFTQPPPVTENNHVTLLCSTSILCNSIPQIETTKHLPLAEWPNSLSIISKSETKTINHTFTASWKDDGRIFSCQTQDNTDKYLIQNITLTVEYAPKEVQASKNREPIKEGDRVILTCSAKGQPAVTFSWFKNGIQIQEGQLQFPSITRSDNGTYRCQAKNKVGTSQSTELKINVFYKPEVHVKIEHLTSRHHTYIKEGEKITLVCKLTRSNPKPNLFTWSKDGKKVSDGEEYVFDSIKAEDSGSYQCTAKNAAGLGNSQSVRLQVLYKPRVSKISTSAMGKKVKIKSSLTLTCNSMANPEPFFSWYHYKQSEPKKWTPLKPKEKITMDSIQRTDEGCYICNASNMIGEGEMSEPECIQVLFPPINISLSLASKVKEGQSITVICNAESFPLSTFELKRSSTADFSTSQQFFSQPANRQNCFTRTFNATSAHAGFYSCIASNSEGSNRSSVRKLEVEYSPKDVRVIAFPSTEVKENASFSLNCSAHSNPPITHFKWITKRNNKEEITMITDSIYTVYSSKPSDSGLYRCEVQNVIGSGKSEVEIKIKYAPKGTTIIKGKEHQDSRGRDSVTLSCSSHSYPPAEYIWYNKTQNTKIGEIQNLTVNSQQAGEYYCIAKNEMGLIMSDSVRVFDDTVKKIIKVFCLLGVIVVIIVIIFLYRRKMKKTNQRTTSRWSGCSFLLTAQGFRSLFKRSERRNKRNENIFTAASRSRDDLLTEQHRHQQPCPDVTSTTHHSNVVYSTVNVPSGKQAPSAQKPGKSQQMCIDDDSLNYASLHFQRKKKEGAEAVYAQVCKPKLCKQQAQEKVEDYENISMVPPIRSPYIADDDTETSDEEEVKYTQVKIIPNPSGQSDTTDSSTSEDETRYSEVKL